VHVTGTGAWEGSRERAVQFRVLGALEVHDRAEVVPLRSTRQRTLLAALLAEANAVVPLDTLADALWGAQPPSDPRNAIQTYVARLRASLGDGLQLVTRPPGYALEVGPEDLDALRFDALLRDAQDVRADDPRRARALLDEALSLWRGPAYAGFADGVARAEALRLTERRLTALEERAAVRLVLGEAADVVGELEALVASSPLRERFVELLVRGLAQLDRTVDALRVHREHRQRLVEETGLEPSAALLALEGQVLRGELGSSRIPPAPPSGPASPSRTSLPTAPSELLGRDRELAEIPATLARHRLVTLTGVGGVGKTRLALDVAAAADRQGRGDVAWVELAPVATPGAVDHVVAGVLGIDLTGGGSARERLLTALADRRVLLVLDNAEHLLDTVAALVDPLLRRAPSLRVLATSRERLAVDGEVVFPVGPLPLPEAGDPRPTAAVELFLARARAAAAGDLTGQLDTVAAICRELDGLPLAIELAAARTGTIPSEELLLALRDDVTAAGQRRSRTGRHRDLWAVVDWSYRLLDEEDRRLFERLSVFAGAFGVDEAHQVCGTEGATRGTTATRLAGLAERSLLVGPEPGTGRYRSLRPLRAHARQRLADRGETGEFADRHAEVVLAAAERAAGPPLTDAGRRWLESAMDDLRAVHRRALTAGDLALLGRLLAALFWFDYWRPGAEVAGWAEEALTLPDATTAPVAPLLFACAATAAWVRGDLPAAAGLASRATAYDRADDRARTLALAVQADVTFFEGELEAAARSFRTSARLARAGGDPDSEANGLAGAALALAYRGRTEEAIAAADEAYRRAVPAGPAVRAFARYVQGECRAEGDPDVAVELLEHAVALARASDAWFVEGVALVTAASLRGRGRDPASALPAYGALVQRWRRSGSWPQQWTTLRNLAELLVRLGDVEPAVHILAAASAEAAAASASYGTEADRSQQALATARAHLGETAFKRAWSRGETTPGNEIVDLALATIDARDRRSSPRAG
jgi:predicted ATPase/DNA-binding SARP family transcriptional activator